MMVREQDRGAPTPAKPIRRFDVFAEVQRLEALAEGRSEDEAKGHGIWLAKVVAARRFGQKGDGDRERRRVRQEGEPAAGEGTTDRFRSVGDELQTDETFDREIVERMGRDFYDRVFAPAVAAALARGERYEQFRDAIRADWKPTRG
jgi:hypothetical protein